MLSFAVFFADEGAVGISRVDTGLLPTRWQQTSIPVGELIWWMALGYRGEPCSDDWYSVVVSSCAD
jgi:hypothetical protein